MLISNAGSWIRRIPLYGVRKVKGIAFVATVASTLFSPCGAHADGNVAYWNLTQSGRYDLDCNWWLTPEGGATTAPNGPDAVAAFLRGGNGEASPWVIDFTFISPVVDHFYFGENAGYYRMAVGGSSLTFSGQGIVNESGKWQELTVGNNGVILFQNGASAGTSWLTASGSGKIIFRDDATASDASIFGWLDFSQINADSFKVGSFRGGNVTMGSKDFIVDELEAGESRSLVTTTFGGTNQAFLIQQDRGSRTLVQSGSSIGGLRVDSGELTFDVGVHNWSSTVNPLDIRGGEVTIRGGAKVSMSGGEAWIRGQNDAAASLVITGNGTEVEISGFFSAGRDFHGEQYLEISDRATLRATDFWVGFYGAGTALIDRGTVNALGAVVGTGDSSDDRGVLEIKGAVGSPGRLFVEYDLDVGGRQWETSGSGYLLAGARTTVRANNLNLARSAGGDGEVEITGSGAMLEVLNDITSGYRGTGRLTISDDATAEVAGALYVGRESGSDGMVTVRSGGSLEPAAFWLWETEVRGRF